MSTKKSPVPQDYPFSFHTPNKFREDLECVLISRSKQFGSLYIGNVQAAKNIHTLQKLKIQAVLGCAKGHQLNHPQQLVPYYKYIPTIDNQSFDLSPYIEESVRFIFQMLRVTNILVHCVAGVSRSVSMVLAFLMKHHGMSFDDAYYLVKSRRNIMNPNKGFIRTLKKYELSLRNSHKTANSIEHKNINQNPNRREISIRQTLENKSVLNRSANDIRHNVYEQRPNHFYTPTKKDHETRQQSIKIQQSKSLNKINQTPYKTPESSKKQPSTQSTLKNISTYQSYIKQGYFDNLNAQLNEKIQAIRSKYQSQRQQLHQSFKNKQKYINSHTVSSEKPENLKENHSNNSNNAFLQKYTTILQSQYSNQSEIKNIRALTKEQYFIMTYGTKQMKEKLFSLNNQAKAPMFQSSLAEKYRKTTSIKWPYSQKGQYY